MEKPANRTRPPTIRASALSLVVGALVVGTLAWSPPAAGAGTDGPDMVLVPAGAYVPFFKLPGGQTSQPMAKFWLDVYPVTNAQFLDFVTTYPQWRKSNQKTIFADGHYLDHWPDDHSWGAPEQAHSPITNVSWFAANAYCRAQGKSLPTTAQWEYALADDGRDKDRLNQDILDWYAKPNSQNLPPVGRSTANHCGIHDLVGLVWEWTLDFNGVMSGAELRQTGKDKSLFCGGGALNASDASDYAAFMRYSLRSSLKATYTTPNLGFRCAKEAP